MSVYEWEIMNPPGNLTGIENYNRAFSSATFWTSWSNTLELLFIGFLLGFWPPLLQAIFLSNIKRGQWIFRVLYLLPFVVPAVAQFTVWKWIYDQDYGVLNSILGRQDAWLGDAGLVKLSLCFPMLLGGGIGVFIYLAAIKGIPKELFEAAELDGAGPFRQLIHILLPRIKYVIVIQLILAIAQGFQVLDKILVLTEGGPAGASTTVAFTIYHYAFRTYEIGYGAAIAVTLFIAVFAITAIQLRLSRSKD